MIFQSELAGAQCLTCHYTEAECAGAAGCCNGCSHLFGEPGRTYRCVGCGGIFVSAAISGCAPDRCPTCHLAAKGYKTGRRDVRYVSPWTAVA